MEFTKKHINAFLKELEKRGVETHAIAIIQNDKLQFKKAYKPFDVNALHPLFSCTKTFTGMAIGLLLDEGKIKLDDLWIDYFPEYKKVCDKQFLEVTIRHLLTMSTGQDSDPIIQGDDNVTLNTITKPCAYPVGTRFFYNSFSSCLLSTLFKRVVGIKLSDYFSQKVFLPLGIQEFYWEEDKKGNSLGGLGLHLKVEDLAKFGNLILNGGLYKGKKLLPSWYIKQATAKQIETAPSYPANKTESCQGYGYQLWMNTHNSYRLSGMFAQGCYILPEHKLVIAMNNSASGSQVILDSLFHVLDNNIQEDMPVRYELKTLSGSSLKKLPLHSKLFRSYHSLDNPLRISDLKLSIEDDVLIVRLKKDGKYYTIHAGYQKWLGVKGDLSKFIDYYWDPILKPYKKKTNLVFGNYAIVSKTLFKVQIRQMDSTDILYLTFQVDGKYLSMFYNTANIYTNLPVGLVNFVR